MPCKGNATGRQYDYQKESGKEDENMAAQNVLTQEQKERMEKNGFNVAEAMQRFMNNEQLWIKFLKKFKLDTSFGELVKAMEEKDATKAFEASHTLKGITGSLALSEFNKLVSEQTEYLRGTESNFEAAVSMMPQITEVYENTTKIIDEVCGE